VYLGTHQRCSGSYAQNKAGRQPDAKSAASLLVVIVAVQALLHDGVAGPLVVPLAPIPPRAMHEPAGIAAALPATQIEADYLGETSDTVKKTAAQFTAEQTDRVTSVAGNVVKAVKEEATTQGLTLDGAKTAAGDISAKIGRVVDATGKSVSDRANLGKL
jgi:hypothetical protein